MQWSVAETEVSIVVVDVLNGRLGLGKMLSLVELAVCREK